MRRSLSEMQWTVRAGVGPVPAAVRDRPLPAVVPGCVHLDLVRAGVIGHPDRGEGEREQAWVGRTAWIYECTFDGLDAEPGERVELAAGGLDTIARVTLNGTIVGTAMNMHHPHRFDVTTAMRPGANELRIDLAAPLEHVEQETARLGPRPVNGDWGQYQYIRKAACNFGWDWGPQVPTAGLWRDIELHAWSAARIEGVRPVVRTATAARATLDVFVDVERAEAAREDGAVEVMVEVHAPTGPALARSVVLPPGATTVCVPVEIDDPQLWWPIGLGSQPLYDVVVRLRSGADNLDEWRGRTGLRSVRLDTSPDAHGSAFMLLVNEVPVFCRGANWIPEGLFPSAVTEDRYRARVLDAAGANMNMLRVWGGGIYEHEAFYDACDEFGVLVWQDFMLACATYPEEDPYPALIEEEARSVVCRLARHPSIVMFCGGNENVLALETWGWKEQMAPGRTWGRRYFHEVLPAIVQEKHPGMPYWPDSPTSGAEDRHPQDSDHGDRHTWDARLEGYRDLVPRFVSEFGHQAPPCLATITSALGELPASSDDESFAGRQRAHNGNAGQYDEPMIEHFGGVPREFETWHYAAQLLQARALSTGIEWLRAHAPRCMGALIWQLNDAWTGHSWSIIDVAGRRKLAWHAARESFAPLLVTIQPIEGRPTLFVVADVQREPVTTSLLAKRVRFDGTVLAEEIVDVRIDASSAARGPDLIELLGPPEDPSRELLVADPATGPVTGPVGAQPAVAVGGRATWWFARDRNLRYPPPRWSCTLSTDDDGVTRVNVLAETLLRDLAIVADRLHRNLEPDEQLVTVLPGETWSVRITPPPITPADLNAPGIIRCANDLPET